MKKIVVMLLSVSLLLMFAAVCCGETQEAADYVLTGTIFTGNERNEMISALAIKDGVILYAGDEVGAEAFIGEKTEQIVLAPEQLVTPGLVDAHTHVGPLKVGQMKICMIPEGASAFDCVEALRGFVQSHPDNATYSGKGWINSAFENGCPTADLLNAIETDKPIVVSSSDGHSYWVNTAMMNLAGITKDTEDPKGGKIERYADGSPNGCFRDTAMFLIKNALPLASAEEQIPGIMAAMEEYASFGYTGYLDVLTNENANPIAHPVLDAYEMMDQAGQLEMFVQGGFTVNNDETALDVLEEGIRLRDETAGGMFELTDIKIFMDGVIEGATAYLSEPYSHDPEKHGSSRWSSKEDLELLTKIVIRANEAGMTVHFHAIGDRAISDAIDCVEKAYEVLGDKVLDCRNVITHLQIVQEKDFDRMANLGMVANINPWCTKYPGFYEETEVVYLGEERASNEYPVKSFMNNGVHMAFGTDYGASFTYQSMDCLHILATRMTDDENPNSLLNESERLTVAETLEMMASGGAYQLHKESVFGTLEVGKRADLVVFSKNLLEIPTIEIMSTEIVRTMANGVWIYSK